MVDYLRREGATPAAMTPEAFTDFVRKDIQHWAPIVKRSGATAE
jgi:tripartite-type tricarboxylate transporter receptor subunit TctC